MTLPRALALAASIAGCMTPRGRPAETSPTERRRAYVAAHGDVEPTIREAILAGKLVNGMTLDDARAAIARREHSVGISADRGYDLEAVFRIPHIGTTTSFRGGTVTETPTTTGETQCVLYFRREQLEKFDCVARQFD